MQSFLTEEQILSKGGVLESYIKTNGMHNIQLSSYEACLRELNNIVEEEIYKFNSQSDTTILKFSNIVISNPTIIEENRIKKLLTPHEARIRKEDYWGIVKIDIEIIKIKNDKIIDNIFLTRHPICKFPIMIGSSKCNLYKKTTEEKIKLGECEYDNGGYFITSGHERVLVSQLRMNYNSIICTKSKLLKYDLVADIRSMSEETGHSILIKAYITCNGKNYFFSLPGISIPIAATIVFKAIGLDQVILSKLIEKRYPILYNNLSKCKYSKDEALEYIGKNTMQSIPVDKYKQCAKQIIENELFPHCGVQININQIRIILTKMILRLYLTYNKIHPIDNRDHLKNKRVDTPGMLLRDLFRPLFKRWARGLNGKKIEIMAASTITQSLKHAIMTGAWSAPKTSWTRQGVSQILTRWNVGSTLSHLRRLVIPTGKEGKNTAIREIHPSEAFFICPCETPEGHSVGIVKNFAILTNVTSNVSICNFIENLDFIINIYKADINDYAKYKVWLNNTPIGFVEDIDKALLKLKSLRTRNIIPANVSISEENMNMEREIMIFSDNGRCIRPVFNLKKKQQIKSTDWQFLIKNKYIEYLDIYEIENQVVAMYPKECKKNSDFTYLEIFPSTMLGVMGSMIPFPDHTQSPRNTYQAAMGKQAMSIFTTNTNIRTDTIVHELVYPQEPIVRTHAAEYLGFCDLPFGTNAICAVMCHTGYNQEDAKILNQTSIDLGFMRNYTWRTVTVEESSSGNGYETITVPEPSIYFKSRNYNKLDENGIIKVGSKLNKNDVLVGKIFKKKNLNLDISRVVQHNEEGIVDSVFVTETKNGYKLVKIKIRILRIPETGDKFASCCAQKGTVGLTFGRENIPFTESGITPDIIINAHAFPSRMTINELIEAIAGKIGVVSGKFKYSTPFSSHSNNVINTLCDQLEALGFNKYGNEVMYNGFTGKKFKVKIFIAPIYKQRLKHLVVEKIHARDHGPMQLLYRQPLEGRSRNGGLRFGEMEHDCLVSYGSTNLLLERLFKVSDQFTLPICKTCGFISNKQEECTYCNSNNVKITSIPYASKLLFQLLHGLGIKLIFDIKSSEEK